MHNKTLSSDPEAGRSFEKKKFPDKFVTFQNIRSLHRTLTVAYLDVFSSIIFKTAMIISVVNVEAYGT